MMCYVCASTVSSTVSTLIAVLGWGGKGCKPWHGWEALLADGAGGISERREGWVEEGGRVLHMHMHGQAFIQGVCGCCTQLEQCDGQLWVGGRACAAPLRHGGAGCQAWGVTAAAVQCSGRCCGT